jgi:uncharacterized hydrophobic protein (TIGR00341 family)
MALRLIEISLLENRKRDMDELLAEETVFSVWEQKLAEGKILLKILLSAEQTEPLLDRWAKQFSNSEDFRVILLPVEATVPRPKSPEEKSAAPDVPAAPKQESPATRISREELYADINDSSRLSGVFVVMVALSTIVAIIGQLRSNVAVEIGAMVLAPLLGPNMALSLATTLGDLVLARRALGAAAVGFFVALALSVGAGLVFPFNPQSPEIFSRTNVGLGEVVLALASGTAGALAFTTGVPATLIGVMVAVALLPPLVTFGLLLGAGDGALALPALLLLLANLICVNLAGVLTFSAQGIHPAKWWEADRARRSTRIAIALWVSLLAALVAVISVARHN